MGSDRSFLYGLAVLILVVGGLVACFGATFGGLGSRGVGTFSLDNFLSNFVPCLIPAIVLFVVATWLSSRDK